MGGYYSYTSNFERRLQEHVEGKSLRTATRRPFIPILCEYYYAKSDALRQELYFKTTAGKRVLRLMLHDSLKEVSVLDTR